MTEAERITRTDAIVQTIRDAHADTQAIYLYGTWGGEYQRADSDVDVAVLLPHTTSRAVEFYNWIELGAEVAKAARTGHADLINLRTVESTILCKEVIAAEQLVYCGDEYAKDEFEMLTLSFYQKLREETADIRADILRRARENVRAREEARMRQAVQ